MCRERAEVITHRSSLYAQEERETQEDWAQVRRELKDVGESDAFIKETNTISPAVLGQGKPNGGTEEHQKHRFLVLDRLRGMACLTPPQNAYWHIFKKLWDERRKNSAGQDWGLHFAQEIEYIQFGLLDGDGEAMSKWMENERERVWGDTTYSNFQNIG